MTKINQLDWSKLQPATREPERKARKERRTAETKYWRKVKKSKPVDKTLVKEHIERIQHLQSIMKEF